METVIAKLQAIHLDHHAIQSKQQQKIDRLRRQVQQQKQIIADYQLLLQKLERQKTKKEQKLQKWKGKYESIIHSVPIKQEKNVNAHTETIDLVELPEASIDIEKNSGEKEEVEVEVEESGEEEVDVEVEVEESGEKEEVEVEVEESGEEEEEVEVEVEESGEEEVEVEVEESGEEEEEEEEEEEVFMVKINGKDYYTNNETNGSIYSVADDDDIGDEVGLYNNGKPVFH